MRTYTDEEVARIVHAHAAGAQDVEGDLTPVQPWLGLSEWQKRSIIAGVRLARHGCSPRELHEGWLERHTAAGWTEGAVKDVQRRTHPHLVEWVKLPEEKRHANEVFIAVTKLYPAPGRRPHSGAICRRCGASASQPAFIMHEPGCQ